MKAWVIKDLGTGKYCSPGWGECFASLKGARIWKSKKDATEQLDPDYNEVVIKVEYIIKEAAK